MPPRMDDSKRDEILADIEATAGSPTGTIRMIADRQGVSTASVQRIAKAAGLTEAWSRDQTVNATRARQVDLAAGRAALQERWLVKANEALDRSESACVVFAFGGADNRFSDHMLELPPAADYRSFVTAAAVATDKMVVLAKLDASDDGLSSAVSTIDRIMDVVRGVHSGEVTDPDS